MPLPWKKAKCTRISQLVADHLHSPKRGGSLVVETGFPTSLIDLFVKNRDRLKKSSKKKRHRAADPMSNPPSPPLESSPVSSQSGGLDSEHKNLNGIPACSSGERIVVRDGDVDEPFGSIGDETVESGVKVADVSGVLIMVLKFSLVVVLALGAKKFAVGITMSTSLLIFFEYVGRHVCKLLKPCATAQKTLSSHAQSLLLFLRVKQSKLIREVEGGGVVRVSKAPIRPDSCLNASTVETQTVQPDPYFASPVEEIQVLRVENETHGFDKNLRCKELDASKGLAEKEEDLSSDALESKRKRSRSAKIKSKIRKLVPKKFRGSKNRRQDLKCEGANRVRDDLVVIGEEEQERGEEGEEDDDSGSVSSGAICSSGELFQPDSGVALAREGGVEKTERNSETQRNLAYLIIFLIVLVGLVGGRVLALVLTVSWCLMLKSGGARWRSMRVPLIRSPVKTCS